MHLSPLKKSNKFSKFYFKKENVQKGYSLFAFVSRLFLVRGELSNMGKVLVDADILHTKLINNKMSLLSCELVKTIYICSKTDNSKSQKSKIKRL